MRLGAWGARELQRTVAVLEQPVQAFSELRFQI